MSPLTRVFSSWSGRNEFLLAQVQVAVILTIAHLGNTFPVSYHRNENHDPRMYWIMCGILGVAALATMKREPSARGVQLLSRAQTEEWKGWMQFAFIMYHYYRVYYVYNEIRVFVSAYVWMTGFGNFLYFDKKQDFSLDRVVSMWLRINYFPLMLSFFLGVPLELYYVVPLHTTGFFITMATCYVATSLKEKRGLSYWNSRFCALLLCTVVHVAFYETSLVDLLKLASDEYHFRFQSDKYSALVGIASGMVWKRLTDYMQWAYGGEGGDRLGPKLAQRLGGLGLMWLWWYGFGSINDKFVYNPMHPYIFWMPVAGWLMVRNSSRYLCELHSTALEFFGRITLETYVLQFHIFMCDNVQHIPVVIPGSGKDGPLHLKVLNMLLCGAVFVSMAVWARRVTVSTQMTVVDLMKTLQKCRGSGKTLERTDSDAEDVSLMKAENGEVGAGGEVQPAASGAKDAEVAQHRATTPKNKDVA